MWQITKKATCCAFASALLIGAVIAWRGSPESGAPPVPAPVPGLQWNVGDRQSYDLRIRTEVDVVLGDKGCAPVEHCVEGTLHLRVIECSDATVRVGLRLAPVSVVVAGSADSRRDARLQTPFAAELAPDGAFRRFHLPHDLLPADRVLLEESLRVFEAVVPAAGEASWHTEQHDGTGSYVAAYARTASRELHRRKLRYATPRGGVGEPSRVEVRASDLRFSPAFTGSWLENARGQEELVVWISEHHRVAARQSVGLMRRAIQADDSAFAEGFADARARSGSAERAAQVPIADTASPADRARLRTLLLALDAVGGKDLSLVHELRDLLRRFPELASVVLAFVVENDPGNGGVPAILHAFELAGTPESQTSLTTVMRSSERTHTTRLQAIVALAGVAEPTDATIHTLWHCVDTSGANEATDLGHTALLALGSLGSGLRGAEHAGYGALRERMISALRSSTDAEGTAVVLKAIANTRDPSLAADACGFLASPRASVRAAAAAAIGRLGGAGAHLAMHLDAEADARVRTACLTALDALDHADEQTFATVERLAVSERDTGARLAIARFLGERLDHHPAGRQTLETMLQNTSSNRIRRYLAGKLYRLRASGR